MTLDEFVEQVKREVDEFKANWLEERAKTPEKHREDHWPLDLEEPDWYEQLIVHLQDADHDV